jgi:hypothetical protein
VEEMKFLLVKNPTPSSNKHINKRGDIFTGMLQKKEAENKSRVATPKMFFSLIFHYSESTFCCFFGCVLFFFVGKVKES